MSKEEFLTAHMWMFGVSKKQANIVWEEMKTNPDYVDAVIDVWKDNTRKAFCND